MALQLRPETQARLEAIAASLGLSADAYVEALVEREAVRSESTEAVDGALLSGMVQENGLRVYRIGKPVPPGLIDDAIRRTRDDRARHLLGNLT